MDMNSYVIGIAGGTGCGKSTIIQHFIERFGDKVAVLCQDDYYKEQHDKTIEERAKQNYDCPDAFDIPLFAEHIMQLRSGRSVNCPVYDYSKHDRSDKVTVVNPAPVLLLDGILVLQNERIRNMMDLKIFVDVDADVRILRRLRRDVHERGRTMDSVIDQYLDTVKAMHEMYVEPTKKEADVVIFNDEHRGASLAMVDNCISNFLFNEYISDN